MARIDGIALGAAPPDEINMLIAAPIGAEPYSACFDPVTRFFAVTRLDESLMRLPINLGFVPETQTETGAALPALLYTSHTLAPGLLVAVRPVGVLYISGDGNDEVSILAVPAARLTRRFDMVTNYADLPARDLRQIAHFFCHYRDLDERRSKRSAGWGDVSEAHRTVMEAAERARN